MDYIRAYIDPQTLTTLLILGAIGFIVIPKLPGISTLLEKLHWPSFGGSTSDPTEDRVALHNALCLLSDRAAKTTCEELKGKQDAAITELSKMVPRTPDYRPTGTVATTT